MNFTGNILNVAKDWLTGKWTITLQVNEQPTEAINELAKCEKLSIILKLFRKKRSRDANAMLWACLGEIAKAMNPPIDKWEAYLLMLRRYGKYTYICAKPNAVDAIKAQWRETEVVGDIDINGEQAVQMLCYFGSSSLDTKEFSVLLDGVINEMRQMGLQPPPTKDMERALELWEKQMQKA